MSLLLGRQLNAATAASHQSGMLAEQHTNHASRQAGKRGCSPPTWTRRQPKVWVDSDWHLATMVCVQAGSKVAAGYQAQ